MFKRNVLIVRHVPNEPAGTLEGVLTNAGLAFEYVDLFDRVPRDLPLIHSAGLVVLGGPMNVDEVARYPFLAREVGWIQAALEQRVPMLGICLGAQLLAKALGARVYPSRHREVGWHPIQMTSKAAGDALFSEEAEQAVFQWHGDTFDLPFGAVHLASSPLCPHQAFRYDSLAWGLQFHIEMTSKMVEDWVSEGEESGDLRRWNVEARPIREQTQERLPELQAMADRVLNRFTALCKSY